MRQLDRLWKYQAADKKVADYETEIRQFPLRQQLLKLRNIVADQQTVVRGMENDANKALARLEELTAQRDKAEAALEEIKKSLADNAFETAAQVHRAIAQMADAEGKLKSAEKELSKMVSHSQMMENRYKEVRTKAAKARDEYTRLKAGYDKEFEKQTARLEELKQERADAAQGIDDILEAVEVDLGVVGDGHAGHLGDRLDGERRAADGVGGVQLLQAVALDLDLILSH